MKPIINTNDEIASSEKEPMITSTNFSTQAESYVHVLDEENDQKSISSIKSNNSSEKSIKLATISYKEDESEEGEIPLNSSHVVNKKLGGDLENSKVDNLDDSKIDNDTVRKIIFLHFRKIYFKFF